MNSILRGVFCCKLTALSNGMYPYLCNYQNKLYINIKLHCCVRSLGTKRSVQKHCHGCDGEPKRAKNPCKLLQWPAMCPEPFDTFWRRHVRLLRSWVVWNYQWLLRSSNNRFLYADPFPLRCSIISNIFSWILFEGMIFWDNWLLFPMALSICLYISEWILYCHKTALLR
jgi:hypothetical protein